MKKKVDWAGELKPLIKKYRGKKHPLNYENKYQLVVMVILSSRATDKSVNALAPALFAAYPTLRDMAKANLQDLLKYTKSVPGSIKKSNWIIELAQKFGSEEEIPKAIKELTALKGIGRKTANVIIRESGGVAEGVIVDLHVLRVAPRIGIAKGNDPLKVEMQLMNALPQEIWGDVGMAFSFLGRELCRPTDPNCPECTMNGVCAFYRTEKKVRKK